MNQLCSLDYEADDMSGIPDLIEVIRLQTGGPTEAARAIRKKLYIRQNLTLHPTLILTGSTELSTSNSERSLSWMA